MVQLSHLYMTTGKTIALTIYIFVCKMMSLLCNSLPRFVITLGSKCLNFMAAVTVYSDLEPKKIKASITVSTSVCHEVIGLDTNISVFLNFVFQASFFTLFHPYQ